ncbi:unnamed protein product [Nyctereutes procyonoides]|uniref:(raccoon dog) hypothetical protein n=1 Tax=Nyctereutes procyonoides TaxID=34880 RepID=A0A811YXY6_NYCPR|nr:unnamed protein product [Nyctereutes procyonoides]
MTYHVFFIHGHMGSFHFLAIINIIALNIRVHVSLQIAMYPLDKYLGPFWILYSVPWIYVSVFVPVPYFLDDHCLLAVQGAFVGASLLVLWVHVLCAVLSHRRRAHDSLFVICALSLAACLCLVALHGTSACQAAVMSGAMVLLYASWACYNLAALALAPQRQLDAFDYDWYNKGYLVFGLILFVWELLPTTLLVGFFPGHRPPQGLSISHILNGQAFDEGCSWEHDHCSGSWYDTIGWEPGWCGGSQTQTTLLLFSQVLGPGGHHQSLYSTPQT